MKSTYFVSGLLIGLGVFAYIMAGQIPHRGSGLGPGYYPQLLSLLLIILSLALMVKTFLRPDKEAQSLTIPDKKTLIRTMLLLLALVLYALAMTYLGYFLATLLFLIALFYLFDERNFLLMGAWAFGLTMILWWVFDRFLQVPLPTGFWG